MSNLISRIRTLSSKIDHSKPVQSPAVSFWNRATYRTGDGEVTQHVRPGSTHAFTLPSRGFK
jgi:hypothetical protein